MLLISGGSKGKKKNHRQNNGSVSGARLTFSTPTVCSMYSLLLRLLLLVGVCCPFCPFGIVPGIDQHGLYSVCVCVCVNIFPLNWSFERTKLSSRKDNLFLFLLFCGRCCPKMFDCNLLDIDSSSLAFLNPLLAGVLILFTVLWHLSRETTKSTSGSTSTKLSLNITKADTNLFEKDFTMENSVEEPTLLTLETIETRTQQQNGENDGEGRFRVNE